MKDFHFAHSRKENHHRHKVSCLKLPFYFNKTCFSWVSVEADLIWHISGELVWLITYRWKKLGTKSRKNKTLIYSKSYFSSWIEYCFLQGANKMLMSEIKYKIQRVYYVWVSFLSFLTSPAKTNKKKELMKRVNAAAWHQLHSQGDYPDPVMEVRAWQHLS